MNEKVALDIAIGASISGKRSLCIMKHVGLNVASDSINVVNLTGVIGGLVIIVGIDPDAYSSQNSMDVRYYAKMANIPYFEAADPGEAKELTNHLFKLSENNKIPVILGVSSKVANSMGPVEINDIKRKNKKIKFDRNGHQFVCMPFNVREKTEKLNLKIDKIANSKTFF